MDSIAHLDFGAEEAKMPGLRERATAAYQGLGTAAKLEVLDHAQRKVRDVLGEILADDIEVTIVNVRDGDGEVRFTIDGMKFKVKVTFQVNSADSVDRDPSSVILTVQVRGSADAGVDSLAELGRLIDSNRVEFFEPKDDAHDD